MKHLFRKTTVLGCCLTVIVSLTSCLGSDEPYQAGFVFYKPHSQVTFEYANNPVDSVVFFSYGPWTVTRTSDGSVDWCNLSLYQGKGLVIYGIPLTFGQNTEGKGRGVQLNFVDADHPNEARAAVLFWQYGVRGDGSLGSAADVKTITGSDGSLFEFEYDAIHRPKSLRITREDALLQDLRISYDDRDSIITVLDRSKTLTAQYDRDYQPVRLVGDGDTIGYYAQYYDNGVPVSGNNAFNVEHHSVNGNRTYYAIKLGGQSLKPDSLHMADSLRIATVTSAGSSISKYKLNYSSLDNRCQSVDVNQLILGADQCDPYQLISLFRFARNTSVVSSMQSEAVTYNVTTTVNADKSVNTLTVSSNDAAVTYTFEY